MSRKRGNEATASEDEDEDEDERVESGSSKRRRQNVQTQDSLLGNGMDHDGSDEEEDQIKQTQGDNEEEEEYEGVKSKGKGKANGKGKKRARDDEEEEEYETDEDAIDDQEGDDLDEGELQIKEDIEANAKKQGAIAQSGVIQKVELTNFMCHKRQTVKFGPQLNFLIGHNGSGKSAFLTAITIALGGKASSTSRGQSFRAFVREGCSSAEVIMTLRNEGEEAFKPDVYGDKVIIERRINSDGGGHWKIKSSEGKTISTKKEELNALTDHCNIQVDNPLNVLSQDAARSFLSSSKADDKYRFFLSGTQLTQLANEYEIVRGVIDRIKTALGRQEELLPELEQKKADSVLKYKTAEKARRQQQRIEEINQLLVWSQVAEKEGELKALIKDGGAKKYKLEKHQRELELALEQVKNAEAKITENETVRDGAHERTAPLVNQRQQVLNQAKTYKAKLASTLEQEHRINEDYSTVKARINEYELSIEEEINKRIEGDRQKQAKRDQYEANKTRFSSEINTLQHENAEVSEQIRSCGTCLDEIKAREQQAVADRDDIRRNIEKQQNYQGQLQATVHNRLSAYGGKIPDLVSRINSEKRWRNKPLGPIGTFIKVKDERWTQVLEDVIGNVLNAFCVTNHQDRVLLQQLIRQTQNVHNTSVITGSPELFDFEHGTPSEDLVTILRILEISDEFIKRQLINATYVEKSVLIPTRDEAAQLVRRNTPNVKNVYTMDGYQVTGSSKETSSIVVNKSRNPPRLSRDTSNQLRAVADEIQSLSNQLRAADSKLMAVRSERQNAEKTLNAHKKRHPIILKQMRSLKSQLEALEDDINEDAPIEVSALESAKRDAEEELRRLGNKFSAVQSEKEKIESEIEPLDRKADAIKAQIQGIESSFVDVAAILEKAVSHRLTAQNKVNHHTAEINKFEPQVRTLEASIDETEEEVKAWTAQALEYCNGQRHKVEKSHNDYVIEKEALLNQQKKNSRRGEANMEAIVEEMRALAKRSDDAKKEFEEMNNLRLALEASLKMRVTQWNVFRTCIAARAKMLFMYHLQNRGYNGKLIFDHDKQTLRLKVQTEDPNATQNHKKGRKDPTSLSGGEKSFSTICLLLSLWEAIGCPIRCLDEFDVFMDAVNRKIAMEMMILNAKASNAVQYILITPQGMQAQEGTEGVYITKMNDPIRNQATLN